MLVNTAPKKEVLEENLLQWALNGGRCISSQNMYANPGIFELSPSPPPITTMAMKEREREEKREEKDREGLQQSVHDIYFFVIVSSTQMTI